MAIDRLNKIRLVGAGWGLFVGLIFSLFIEPNGILGGIFFGAMFGFGIVMFYDLYPLYSLFIFFLIILSAKNDEKIWALALLVPIVIAIEAINAKSTEKESRRL